VSRPINLHLPDVRVPGGSKLDESLVRDLRDALSTTRRNFQRIKEILERNIEDGTITEGGTLAGDVTGPFDTSVVEKIRGNTVPDPGASEDDKLLRYAHDGAFTWESIEELLDDLLTTSGDLLYRSGSTITRLALGSANFLLAVNSGATAPTWASVSAMIDAAIGNTQGNVLFRGASGWEVLAPGTAGKVLNTNGAGANPSWEDASGGVPGTDFDLLTDEDGLVLDDGEAIWT